MLEVSVWVPSSSSPWITTLYSEVWTCNSSSKCHLNRCQGEEISCPTLATQTSRITRCSITSSSLLPSNNLRIIASICSVGSLNLALTPSSNNNSSSSQTSTNKLTLVNSNSKRHQLNRQTIIWLTLTRWISSNNSRDKEEHGTLPNSRNQTMYGRRVVVFSTCLTLSQVINLASRSIILHKLTITEWTYSPAVTILTSYGLNQAISTVVALETSKIRVVLSPWLA